jgi:Stage II sporulation protein E (SpoIIE)
MRGPSAGWLDWIAGVTASVALLAASCAPAAAQGPPGGVPPGQAKKDATQAVAALAVAAPATAPAVAAPAPVAAPGDSGSAPGRVSSSNAPGRVKKAAVASALARTVTTSLSPARSTSAGATSTPSATPVAQASPASQPAATPRHQTRHVARPVQRAGAAQASAPVPARTRATSPATGVAPGSASRASTDRGSSVAAPPRHRVAHRSPATAPTPLPPLLSITGTVTHTVREIAHVVPGWVKAVIAGLAALLAVAGLLLAAARRRNRRLTAAVSTLEEVLLPDVPEHIGGLAVSVAYRPAEGVGAGGDFYDVFPLEHGSVGMILGDVVGHGRETLQPATFVRHTVRAYLEAGLTPRAAIQLAGNVLDDQDSDDFATIVAGVYDPEAGTLSYATAGHPPPIVTGPAGHEPLVVAASPPAGVGATTGRRQTTVALPRGSTVCFFTDGLSEARTKSGRVFGRDRVEQALRELGDGATADDLVERVAQSTEGLADDVAVCMIRPENGAAAATVRVEEIEVTKSDLQTPRLRRFLEACGVARLEAEAAIRAATPRVAGLGSVLLRVRLADDRSGVDVVPVESARVDELAPVHSLR